MAIEDKIKWEKKYETTPKLLENRPQSKKLEKAIEFTDGKNALDVACGSGRNSIFLAKNGFNVTSIDISQLALKTLEEQNINNITTKQVDLDTFEFEKESYDLIIMINFLDRNLFQKLLHALKKDGVFLIETYMFHEENEKPPSNPNFLLKKDELKEFFEKKAKILDYDEFFNESYELYKMRKQSIIVKKSL